MCYVMTYKSQSYYLDWLQRVQIAKLVMNTSGTDKYALAGSVAGHPKGNAQVLGGLRGRRSQNKMGPDKQLGCDPDMPSYFVWTAPGISTQFHPRALRIARIFLGNGFGKHHLSFHQIVRARLTFLRRCSLLARHTWVRVDFLGQVQNASYKPKK